MTVATHECHFFSLILSFFPLLLSLHIIQISKMTGRDDDEVVDQEDLDPHDSDRGLDLAVSDYKPGFKRQVNTVFTDPDKNPRFEEFTKGGDVTNKHYEIFLSIVL